MLDLVRHPEERRIALVLKGYPRLSETFVAQEILGLEGQGFGFEIWSLRRPTDGAVHMMHRKIAAKAYYLPEYLHQEPMRVLRGFMAAFRQPGRGRLARTFARDLFRDPTPNRLRRLGQALVLARELSPSIAHVHVHFLHTPGSVARYAALLSHRSFSISAHAKDIWTLPDWEKREKLADAMFTVTCTAHGHAELERLAPPGRGEDVGLVYHGLDLTRFPAAPEVRPYRDGSDKDDPVVLVSVGRAVAKKGYEDLLEALARLPSGLAWRFVHIGPGELLAALKARAAKLGIADRITWHGAKPQEAVIAELAAADLFVLACKEGKGGDRDGLPNVLLEAATQALPIVSTRFAGVPEFVRDGVEGLLVEPGDVAALAGVLARLARAPDLRERLGRAAALRIAHDFSFEAGLKRIAARLDRCLADAALR